MNGIDEAGGWSMWQERLQRIAQEMMRFGMQLQLPCSHAKVEELNSTTKKELGLIAPEEYLSFLRFVDGLDWNGLVIYASRRRLIVGYSDRFIEGFVEGNLAYRDFDPLRDYRIFADDGVVLFTYNIPHCEYQVITSAGLTLLETASSFDELIANAMQAHL